MQTSPVRPQSPEVDSWKPAVQPVAVPKANPGPPPALTRPKGILEVQEAARMSNELEALRHANSLLPNRAPAVEVSLALKTTYSHLKGLLLHFQITWDDSNLGIMLLCCVALPRPFKP